MKIDELKEGCQKGGQRKGEGRNTNTTKREEKEKGRKEKKEVSREG